MDARENRMRTTFTIAAWAVLAAEPADDPQERVTIFMVGMHRWSDGTPAP